jgi:hypothetical protein
VYLLTPASRSLRNVVQKIARRGRLTLPVRERGGAGCARPRERSGQQLGLAHAKRSVGSGRVQPGPLQSCGGVVTVGSGTAQLLPPEHGVAVWNGSGSSLAQLLLPPHGAAVWNGCGSGRARAATAGPCKKEPWGAGGSADRAPTSRPHSFACATEPEGGDQGLGCGVLQSLSSAEPWPGMRHCVAPPRPGPYLRRQLLAPIGANCSRRSTKGSVPVVIRGRLLPPGSDWFASNITFRPCLVVTCDAWGSPCGAR